MLEKQDKNIELETARVVVKKRKRKEDFMIPTTDMSNTDDKVNTTHMFYRDAILQEMGIRRAVTMLVTGGRIVATSAMGDQDGWAVSMSMTGDREGTGSEDWTVSEEYTPSNEHDPPPSF
jgi:hypothetical protein